MMIFPSTTIRQIIHHRVGIDATQSLGEVRLGTQIGSPGHRADWPGGACDGVDDQCLILPTSD
jgi:hypothetical protein